MSSRGLFSRRSPLRGVRAGEEPTAGWTLCAAGACLVVFALAVLAGLSMAVVLNSPMADTQPMFTAVGQLAAGIVALAYLALLGGFVVGLPSGTSGRPDDRPAAN